MNVIFLDVDGVLNNVKYLEKCYKRNGHFSMSMYNYPFDPYNLKQFSKLARKFKAKIVLTSTWRLDSSAKSILSARLAEYGVKIYDSTKYLGATRGVEIKDWLKTYQKDHVDKVNYLVIDDDVYDLASFIDEGRIVQTTTDYGFTFGDRLKAEKILREVK